MWGIIGHVTVEAGKHSRNRWRATINAYLCLKRSGDFGILLEPGWQIKGTVAGYVFEHSILHVDLRAKNLDFQRIFGFSSLDGQPGKGIFTVLNLLL